MDYRSLTIAEARLLLVLRDNPRASKEEAIELAGLSSDSRYYHAKKTLRTLGLLPHTDGPATPAPLQPKEPQSNKVARIMQAYRAAFHTELKAGDAAQMLKSAQVEEVIEVVRSMTGKTVHRPVPYILSILKNRTAPSPKPAKPVAKVVEPIVMDDEKRFQSKENDELLPPSPEFLAQVRRVKSKQYQEWDRFNDT